VITSVIILLSSPPVFNLTIYKSGIPVGEPYESPLPFKSINSCVRLLGMSGAGLFGTVDGSGKLTASPQTRRSSSCIGGIPDMFDLK
jgi:hypothetical protein